MHSDAATAGEIILRPIDSRHDVEASQRSRNRKLMIQAREATRRNHDLTSHEAAAEECRYRKGVQFNRKSRHHIGL